MRDGESGYVVFMKDDRNQDHSADMALAGAVAGMHHWSTSSPKFRAQALNFVSMRLEESKSDLVNLAMRETSLAQSRLEGELTRTAFQLRLFAEVLLEGSFLEATIDHADPYWPSGPRPDIRRVLNGIGPVLVFAAGNFPFAFSIAGGDTASALAAGCSVVVKAHPGHPELSSATAKVVSNALLELGVNPGLFSVIYGEETGRAALLDSRLSAAAFTGSTSSGRLLFDLACSRSTPIPFYGELGSLNPVFVTPGALASRKNEIIEGFINSFTLGAGQFCTKPGLLFVPAGEGIEEALADKASELPRMPFLNPSIGNRYLQNVTVVRSHSAVKAIVQGFEDKNFASPSLAYVALEDISKNKDELLAECFGPMSIVVGYKNYLDLMEFLPKLEGQLTATIHANDDEEIALKLASSLGSVAGRIIWNQWPTGVSVTWAMHHGGPYPATTCSLNTSVGAAAIKRFLRPISYQNCPEALLPLTLRESNPWQLPRRIDGVWNE